MRRKSILLSLLIFLLATAVALGVSNLTGKYQRASTALGLSEDITIDANALEMFVYNDGNFAYDNIGVMGKTDGLYFPRGTRKTVVYAAGLWLGAKVNGEQAARIAQAEYSSEFIPGNMENGTYNPNWQDDQYRVYKISRGDDDANSVDYRDWPVGDGAPVDQDDNPELLGDQLLWSVYNDADASMHQNESGGTQPLGVEVQQSTFAFARAGALGDCIFMKFKFINKGGNDFTDMYVSIWADPDLGNASDDLVGCDTTLSLGYCYNSGPDDIYGSAPPAVGFDFFQGPIVPGGDTDTAYVSGVPKPGYKNLPMTSFAKYINGEDPRSAAQTYDFMNGLRKNPGTGLMEPAVDPNGDTTKFVLAGDPVTNTGWLDTSPDDRRLMMSSGPFSMAPGDTQEVVCAVLVGQGADPLNSITVLRTTDVAAQTVFDLNFKIPPPPPSPSVIVRGADKAVDIIWGDEPVGDVEADTTLGQEFHFEGFNLYQGETAVGPWHKFATYDLADDPDEVALIYGDVVDPAAGGTERVILQKGSNSGLEFHTHLTTDQIVGGPYENNRPYFFAVTAYSYDYLNIDPFEDLGGNLLGYITESLESPIISYEVRPYTFVGTYDLTADHITGTSDGKVEVEFVDPDSVVSATWEVTFNEDLSWNLQNITSGDFLLENMTKQDGNYDYPIVNGMMVRTQGPEPGFKDEIVGTDDLSIYFTEAYMGGRNANNNKDFRDFMIKFVAGSNDRVWAQIDGITGTDTSGIFRYLDEQGDTIWGVPLGATSDADLISPPFKIYDLGDDYQNPQPTELWPLFYDFYGDGNFYIDDYILLLDKNSTGCKRSEDFFSNPDHLLDEYWGYDPADPLSRYDWDYRFAFDAIAPWNAGDSIIFVAYKANTPDDIFRFSTKASNKGDGTFVPLSLENVKTVPNPYYAYYPEEVDQFNRIMKFINLPAVPLNIKIFNLAGDLVRTMDRTTDLDNPEYIWDLKTDQGLWVASGIYVWLIEAEGLGSRFGKMAIFTEVEQLNNF